MPKKSDEELQSHNIFLFRGDFERLLALTGNKIPGSQLIRLLVRETIKKIEKRAGEKQLLTLSEEELELDG